MVVFIDDCNRPSAFEQKFHSTPGVSSFHPIISETNADHARNGANICLRMIKALACNAARTRPLRTPPDYHAAVENEFMPNAREANVDHARVFLEYPVVSKALADKCVAPKPG